MILNNYLFYQFFINLNLHTIKNLKSNMEKQTYNKISCFDNSILNFKFPELNYLRQLTPDVSSF